jgi:hypothetical protein
VDLDENGGQSEKMPEFGSHLFDKCVWNRVDLELTGVKRGNPQ